MSYHKPKPFNRVRLVTGDYMKKHYKEDIIDINDKLIEENLIKENKQNDN
jgi:hypothetical protein